MHLLTSLLVPTYPDPPGPKVASNAVAVANQLGATLDAAVINVDIPDVSNALSSLLLDLPEKIREVNASSRKRGKALLETVASEAARCNVTLTSQELKAQPAFIGETAAREGRYFDLCMVGWTRNIASIRATAEEVVFSSGRPTLIFGRRRCRCARSCGDRLGRQPRGCKGCGRRQAVPRAGIDDIDHHRDG